MSFWSADYAIIYQDKVNLDKKWLKSFDLISVFSWKEYQIDLKAKYLKNDLYGSPYWFLLKIKESTS